MEFQPSSWRAGQAYLNVGEQHLWLERDHIVFEEPDRPLGAAHTADLASDDSVLVVLMDTAAEAVTRRIAEHEEGDAALRRLVRLDDDLNAGIAAALLGDVPTATQRLSGAVHPAYTAQAGAYRDATVSGTAGELAETTVSRTRTLLRLPPAASMWNG